LAQWRPERPTEATTDLATASLLSSSFSQPAPSAATLLKHPFFDVRLRESVLFSPGSSYLHWGPHEFNNVLSIAEATSRNGDVVFVLGMREGTLALSHPNDLLVRRPENLRVHKNEVVAAAANGENVATGDADGLVYVWKMTSHGRGMKAVYACDLLDHPVFNLHLNDNYLALADENHAMYVLAAGGDWPVVCEGKSLSTSFILASTDQRVHDEENLASSGVSGLRLIERNSSAAIMAYGHRSAVTEVALGQAGSAAEKTLILPCLCEVKSLRISHRWSGALWVGAQGPHPHTGLLFHVNVSRNQVLQTFSFSSLVR